MEFVVGKWKIKNFRYIDAYLLRVFETYINFYISSCLEYGCAVCKTSFVNNLFLFFSLSSVSYFVDEQIFTLKAFLVKFSALLSYWDFYYSCLKMQRNYEFFRYVCFKRKLTLTLHRIKFYILSERMFSEARESTF